ncbi:unnamed protein product, partial [Adineta steineri]
RKKLVHCIRARLTRRAAAVDADAAAALQDGDTGL